MQPAQSSSFSWVRERSRCSLGVLFGTLATAIKQDVDTANELLQEIGNKHQSFKYNRDRNVITVIRSRRTVTNEIEQHTVEFTVSSIAITVSRDEAKQFSAIPSLSTEGKCTMIAEGDELEIWQVCRKALEDLFFA